VSSATCNVTSAVTAVLISVTLVISWLREHSVLWTAGHTYSITCIYRKSSRFLHRYQLIVWTEAEGCDQLAQGCCTAVAEREPNPRSVDRYSDAPLVASLTHQLNASRLEIYGKPIARLRSITHMSHSLVTTRVFHLICIKMKQYSEVGTWLVWRRNRLTFVLVSVGMWCEDDYDQR